MSGSRFHFGHDSEAHASRQMMMFTGLWLMVGLGVGAVMALLYAPASGKKTRRKLFRRMEEGLDSGQETIESVIDRLESEVEDLRETLEERIAKLR